MKHKRVFRTDIILLSVDFFGEETDIKLISRRLGIREKTLGKYYSSIKKTGFISYKKYNSDISIRLTLSGRRELIKIYEIIEGTILHPETSGFAEKVQLKAILDHLQDPYDKLEFLDRFFLKRGNNAISIINEIKSMRSDSRYSKYINEILSIKSDSDGKSLENVLKSSSLYSLSYSKSRSTDLSLYDDPDWLILRAEVLKRTGSPEEAQAIYDGLIHRKTGLDSARWILCLSGKFQCMFYTNHESEAIQILDKVLESVENPIEKGFLKKIKADMIQGSGRLEEASELYKSCLGLFNGNEFPVIRASTLNNLGVLYLRRNNQDMAISLWEEAYKIVVREKVTWSMIMTSINLADAYSLRGNTTKAMRLLGKARTVLRGIGDQEGLSDVDFNMALVQIEKGDFIRARQYFENAESYPLTYENKRRERKKVFEGRIREKMK